MNLEIPKKNLSWQDRSALRRRIFQEAREKERTLRLPDKDTVLIRARRH